MERSFSRRLFALLIAFVFLFSWAGDALGYHPCPHHSWIAGAGEAHASGDHAHHAGHVAVLASADDGEAPHAGQPAEHGACTCSGGCPSVTGALPAGSANDLRVAFTPGETPRLGVTERPGRRFDPFFLPYGQAPPLG